jgi:hypothetical protein
MSRLTLTGAGGGGDSFDPRRTTGLLFAYNLDETDDGTRYPFDSKGPDLSTVVNAPDNPVGGGVIGEAMQGDGTQYVKSTDASIETTLDGLEKFSFQFWYNQTYPAQGGAAYPPEGYFLNFNYIDPAIYFGHYGSYDYVRYYVNGSEAWISTYTTPSTNWLWRDGWHHHLFTFDGTQANADKAKYYFDGVDIASAMTSYSSAPTMTALNPTRSEMEILAGPGGGYANSGSTDLVAFWNWTMIPADVEYEYNSGAGREFTAE